jgi:competence protein ComEC
MTLAYLAAAWLLGVGLMAATGEPWVVAAAAALAFLAPLLARRSWRAPSLRSGRDLAWATLVAALLVGGAWCYDAALPATQPQGIARYNDRPAVRFRAVVSGEPDERGTSVRLRLSAREVFDGQWQDTSGDVLMRAGLFPRHNYGDLLEVTGKLETPPTLEDFDYREYLARHDVYSTIAYPKVTLLTTGQGSPVWAGLYDLRADLGSALADALPEPEASLAEGILLGRRTSLPPSLSQAFNDTGTSHLLAVSGYNVTLVAGLFIAVLAWLIGRRRAAWLALAAIVGYAFLVGGQPSVQRAAVMGGLYVAATALGRQSGALQALALAGAGMTAFDPQLVKDASFQLSFASTLGLIVFAPGLRSHLERALMPGDGDDSLPGPLRAAVELVAVTLSAVAFTLPIVAVDFGRISLVALPANLLTVPTFPLIMITAALTAVGGMVSSTVGAFLGWLTWPAVAYLRAVVEAMADVPSAAVSIDGFEAWHAAVYYAALAGVVWLVARPDRSGPLLPSPPAWLGRLLGRAREPLRATPALGLAGVLTLASVFVWLLVLGSPGERLTVTFLDVGEGDAILIRSPAGHRILVDGGPSGDAISAALGRHLPFWDRHLDLVVLTHSHQDHVTGLVTVLERYDVDQVLAPAVPTDVWPTDAWPTDGWPVDRYWREELERQHIPTTEPFAGQWIDLGGGAWLSVLHPPKEPLPGAEKDDNAVVLKLTLGEASFLLAADLDARAEAYLTNRHTDLRATVLKVAHHGSAGSTSADFLAAVQPLTAVISVGQDNAYGLPATETLGRLEPRPVFRTDLQGDIEISTDGERLWIEVERDGS